MADLYSVNWNIHPQQIVTAFGEFRIDDQQTDVTLSCDAGPSIRAHKLILAACSTYFREMFRDNPCEHPVVILNGVDIFDLRALITFIYTGEVNLSRDRLQPFLKMATEFFQVKGLTHNDITLNKVAETPKKLLRLGGIDASCNFSQESPRRGTADTVQRRKTTTRKRVALNRNRPTPAVSSDEGSRTPQSVRSLNDASSNMTSLSLGRNWADSDWTYKPTNSSSGPTRWDTTHNVLPKCPNLGIVGFENEDFKDEYDCSDNSVQDMLRVDQIGKN